MRELNMKPGLRKRYEEGERLIETPEQVED
jgi:hypothetical protein